MHRIDPDVLLDAKRHLSNKNACRGRGASCICDRYRFARALIAAAERIETLERMDREAATFVESVIRVRTSFTGEPPYVGWRGIGLALTEALDERDALRAPTTNLSAKHA